MNKPRRLVVFALLMLGGAGCGSPETPEARPQPAAQAPTPANVAPTVVSPEYRTRQRTIDTTGKVQFNEESLVRVHAPATGRVLEIFARPGDVVEPGARLFVIDSADLGAAKADYAKAVADVER
jgi:multidrug efflux pump subunit AcrA (membrane-fusion protein)